MASCSCWRRCCSASPSAARSAACSWRGDRGRGCAALAFGWLRVGIGLAAVLALVAFGGAYDVLLGLRESAALLAPRADRHAPDGRAVRGDCAARGAVDGRDVPARRAALGRRRGPHRCSAWAAYMRANVAGAIVGSLAARLCAGAAARRARQRCCCSRRQCRCRRGGCCSFRARPRSLSRLASAWRWLAIAWGATRPPLHEVVFRQHFPDQQLLAYWEGLENTVSVGRTPTACRRCSPTAAARPTTRRTWCATTA